jgi:flavin-dependent dehydrogenase
VRHGAVVGVEGERACYPAAVTIDASGRRHWLARQLGLTVQPYSRRLMARYGYVRGRGPRAAPSLTADPTGWTWLARIGPDLHHWTRLDVAARAPAPVLPPDLRGLAARGRPRAADVTWRAVDRVAGPGYFLAGDAGVVVDPAGGHGVLRALMSGVLAASAAAAGLGGGPARQGAGVYRDWLLGWFHRDVAALARRYRQAGWI